MPADYTIDGYLCAADATIDQVHPRKDILLVRRIPDEEITASGLVVPGIARNPAQGVRIGEVLKCGPGDTFSATPEEFASMMFNPSAQFIAVGDMFEWTIPTECKPGDRIAYMRCPDNDVNIGGIDCVLLREEQHVLAILDAAEPVTPSQLLNLCMKGAVNSIADRHDEHVLAIL